MPPCPQHRATPLGWSLAFALFGIGMAAVAGWGDEPARPKPTPVAELERWYQELLNDDREGGWLNAADRIAQRIVTPATWPDRWLVPASGVRQLLPDLPGETLRSCRKPSVSNLMALRIDDLAARGHDSQAIRMAEHLMAWDTTFALTALQKASRLLRGQIAGFGGQPSREHGSLLDKLARFTLERSALGDPTAPAEYAAVIRLSEPSWFQGYRLDALAPLHRLADDPDLADATRWMFTNPRSPWLVRFWDPTGPQPMPDAARARVRLVTSSLLVLPDFRRAVATWLADPTEAGTVQVMPGRRLTVQTRTGYQTPSVVQRPVPDAPQEAMAPPGPPAPLRLADLVAWQLATLDGAPRFGLDWPVASRDQAIDALRVWMDSYGPYLTPDSSTRPLLTGESRDWAILEMPYLDHPATRSEVVEGRAIFSLEDESGERRVVPLPERPLAARWVAYRRPGERGMTPAGSDRPGRVWQAEEVWRDGHWVRYFGFVVENQMVRLPAAALEFGTGFAAPLDRRFSRNTPLFLVPEGTAIPWASQSPNPPIWPSDAPLPVPIRLRNLRGDDLSVPADLVERREGRIVAIAAGLTLDLTYDPIPATASAPRADAKRGRVEQHAAIGTFNPSEATPLVTLGPGGQGSTTTVDLRDLFAIAAAGDYTLRVAFTRPEAKQPDAVSQCLTVRVGPGSQRQ